MPAYCATALAFCTAAPTECNPGSSIAFDSKDFNPGNEPPDWNCPDFGFRARFVAPGSGIGIANNAPSACWSQFPNCRNRSCWFAWPCADLYFLKFGDHGNESDEVAAFGFVMFCNNRVGAVAFNASCNK